MEVTSSDSPTVSLENRSGTGADSGPGGGAVARSSTTTPSDLKDEARDVAEDASQEARRMVEQQKGAVADSLSSVARALQMTAQQLEGENQTSSAGYASALASSIESVSSSIRDRDLDSLKRDAESFARARPALFLGGCVAVGFALSRMLKASGTKVSSEPESLRASPPGSLEPSDRRVQTPPVPRFESVDVVDGGMGEAYYPEERMR